MRALIGVLCIALAFGPLTAQACHEEPFRIVATALYEQSGHCAELREAFPFVWVNPECLP